MNIFKKTLITLTVVASMSAFAVAPFSAYAAEKILTPAENAPYTILMGINADKNVWEQQDQNYKTFSNDGDFDLYYTFQTGGSSISELILETDLKAEQFPNAKISVNRISIVASSGVVTEVQYDASKAIQYVTTNGTITLRILTAFSPAANAISNNLPVSAASGDNLLMNVNVSGLSSNADNTGTDTLFQDNSNNTVTTVNSTVETVNSTVGTVAQTADPGLTAIAVIGGAAVSLAAVALTIRKKKK